MHGGIASYRPGDSLGPRILSDYEIVLILQGHVTYRRDQIDWPVPPGGIILARPGSRETYLWDPCHPTRHAYFHFDLEALPRHWPAPKHWPVVVSDPDPVVPALMQYLVHRCHMAGTWPAERPGEHDRCMLESLIGTLLCTPAGLGAATNDRPEPVQRTIQWMRRRLDEDPARSVDLTDLAHAANVSGKHLCRLFTRSLGHSPMQVLRLLRLQLGLVLLSRSDLTIKQIATRCGFESPFHFSRCFSDAFGSSPSGIRQQLLQGHPPPPNPLPGDLAPRVFW